jgi:hypothetical protein
MFSDNISLIHFEWALFGHINQANITLFLPLFFAL